MWSSYLSLPSNQDDGCAPLDLSFCPIFLPQIHNEAPVIGVYPPLYQQGHLAMDDLHLDIS